MEKMKLYTIKDLAELYGLHPSFFRNRIKDGSLKAIRIGGVERLVKDKDGTEKMMLCGGSWRVAESDFDVFFASLINKQATTANIIGTESTSTLDGKDTTVIVSDADARAKVEDESELVDESFVDKIREYNGKDIANVEGVDDAIRMGILVDRSEAMKILGKAKYWLTEQVRRGILSAFYDSRTGGRKQYFLRQDCNEETIKSKGACEDVEVVEITDEIRQDLASGRLVRLNDIPRTYVVKYETLRGLCQAKKIKSLRVVGIVQGNAVRLIDAESFKIYAESNKIKLRDI